MDVGFSVFWRFNLYNKVDTRDIKTTGSDISCYENAEFLFFEALECNFTLVLGNISVHDFDIFLHFLRQKK